MSGSDHGDCRSNKFKLEFQLNIKKNTFTKRVVKHQNRYPGRMWNFCPWRYSNSAVHGHEQLGVIGLSLSRSDQMIYRTPFNLHESIVQEDWFTYSIENRLNFTFTSHYLFLEEKKEKGGTMNTASIMSNSRAECMSVQYQAFMHLFLWNLIFVYFQ